MTKKEIVLENVTKLCDILNMPMPQFGSIEFILQDGLIIDVKYSGHVNKKTFNN